MGRLSYDGTVRDSADTSLFFATANVTYTILIINISISTIFCVEELIVSSVFRCEVGENYILLG
jgi:hypothetical protein